ncbi:MAG: hypothetical protein NZ455_09305 [Bacteroidia bacterium]|nr:hypothetical protein [Bacteroidia bacterium]
MLRFAPHWANAHPPHASRKWLLAKSNYTKCNLIKYMKMNIKQGKMNTAETK